MKHIVDGVSWQKACNGVRCKTYNKDGYETDRCSLMDDEGNCRIRAYIERQPVYHEKEGDSK